MKLFRLKHALLVAGVILGLLILIGGPADAKTNLKAAHMFSPVSLPGQSAQKFAELVKEKSNGDLEITMLPGGALGDERANLQQLESGSIDIALTGDLVMSYMARPFMLVSMPFLYDNPDHSLAVFNGPIGNEIGEYLLKNHNIKALAWQYVGTRVVTANKPIRNLEDFKTLKMRLPPAEIWVKTWEKTGVQIASIAFTELYLALQTGTVEGQENPPNFIRAQKFYEVQKFLMPTNHVPQMQVYFMNSERFQSLSDAERRIIEEAAKEATSWTTQAAKDNQASDIKWLTSEGKMTLIECDLSGIQDLIKSVPAEVGGQEGIALYNRIRATQY